jgi:hypothetical protein
MNKWNIQQYSANEIQENIISRKFVIPPFQRNLVWKSQQKAAFIDSFERGLPFGTILLYHNEAENNYQVIDGLQRCYTIFEFLNNPAQFFDERKIDADIPSKIAAQLGFVGCDGSTAAICQHILKLLIDWVKFQHTTIQQVESMQYIGFSQALKTEFAS